MQIQTRKFAWLMLAALATLSIGVGAVVAHEGRPVGDYRFIVGWLEEPAYEGFQNAVSIRVNKIIDAEEAAAMGVQQEEHGEPGHHDEDSETTASDARRHDESGEEEDHHASEDQDGDGEDHHGAEDKDGDGDDHHATTIEAATAMSVAVSVTEDLLAGANVHIMAEGFTFSPENVNGAHVEGEGHAHIYVDGVKIGRTYTPWFYLKDITPGEHEIRVTLNANSHEEYAIDGENVQAVTRFTYHDPHGHSHAPDTREAQGSMAVSIRLVHDGPGSANLFVAAEGFRFAPENAGDHHVPGEGHAHVTVNGADYGRLYGKALQLTNLDKGENVVTVTLNTNDFSDYTWNGEVVQDTATIDIAEGVSTGGHDGHSSMVPLPSGAAKPLASIAGQDEGVAVPVEGLESSLQVEVTHAATGVSRTFDLEAAWGDPGHYVAGLIPTASGVYEFRIFGTIEGTPIDETFVSAGGGGDFDDIQPSAGLQFPEQLPELREVVGAAQGAREIAQQAQDAALAAQADGDGDGGNALVVVALIIGIVGALLGAGGIYLAVQARRSP